MTDDATGAAGAQGADAAKPQGGATRAQGAASAAQGAADGNGAGTVDVEALSTKIADLERDNAKYRREIKGFQDAQKAKDDEGRSEAEQTAKRLQELEAELATQKRGRQDQAVRLAAMTAAQKLGYRNPDLAYRLLDRDALDFADDGTPRNVERLLVDVAKADPYLLTAADFGGGQRGKPGSGTDMNDLIRSSAGRR